MLVREGQVVSAGDPLLHLEDGDARDQLAEAEAALEAATAQQATARQGVAQHEARLRQQEAAPQASSARLAAAHLLVERKEELVKTKLLNEKDLTIAREQVNEAEAADRAERAKLTELKEVDPNLVVRQAEAELNVAQARRQRAERAVEECTLKAPTDGLVQRVLTGIGDVVTGSPQQPLIQFCPAEPRLVRAEVDQEFTDRVSVGQSVLLRDDARPGVQWQGKVLRVADWYAQRRPNPQDPSAFLDVRTIECLIAVEPGPESLRIGQRLRVRIEPGSATVKK
jgi:membrane fusion protein (multidrug efflux system)